MRSKDVWIPAVLFVLGSSTGAWSTAGALISPAPAARPLRLEVVSGRDDGERPTALGAADFDEDGTPDLVRGFASPGGAYLTLHRGDAGALFPQHGRATDAPPFVNPGQEFPLSDAPELLSTGDFDGDGHSDVVIAAGGGDRLSVLAGDGRGGFGPEQWLEIGGSVTAMLAGEIGRRDGLLDLIVGIDGHDGTGVLVFEGPGGALRNEPVFIELPGRPGALALDLLDEDDFYDVAIALGSSLFVVHGEDPNTRPETPSEARAWDVRLDRFDMPSEIAAIASGDFAGLQAKRQQLALLLEDRTVHVLDLEPAAESVSASWKTLGVGWLGAAQWPERGPTPLMTAARLGGKSAQDLVVIEPAAARAHVFAAEPRSSPEEARSIAEEREPPELRRTAGLELVDEPVALLSMRLNPDALSDLVILTRGAETTRLVESSFSSVFTVTNNLDSGSGSLRQAILDANSTGGADTIQFNISGVGPFVIAPSTPLPAIIEAVTVNGYTQPGAQANTVSSPGLSNAILKVEIDGTVAGIGSGLVFDAGSSTVRGLVVRAFSTDDGVTLNSAGNIVEGNYIGTDVTGSAIPVNAGNSNGVQIFGSNNTVGGTIPQARNLISDNGDDGVDIQGAATFGNKILGNFIGTDAAGTDDLDNDDDGVQIDERRTT